MSTKARLVLAWTLSAISLAMTTLFFVLLTAGSAIVTAPWFGPHFPSSIVIGAGALTAMLAFTWIYATASASEP
jgi:hypothetical protein